MMVPVRSQCMLRCCFDSSMTTGTTAIFGSRYHYLFMVLYFWFPDVGLGCTVFADLGNFWMSKKKALRMFLCYVSVSFGSSMACARTGRRTYPSNYI